MKKYPEPGQTYVHYTGGKYKVLHLAKHTETDEEMVVYQSVHFGSFYVRPLTVWNEEVTPIGGGRLVPRFVPLVG